MSIFRSALRMYALAARTASLTISFWGAVLGLFVATSLPARIHDDYALMDIVNWTALTLSIIGFADLIKHDLLGIMLFKDIPTQLRHNVCVLLYAVLGAQWMLRSFVATTVLMEVSGAWTMALFSLSMAVICGFTAVAIALEHR